ncbi:hypothetical protein [Marinobacter sp. Arc7-DN-1]|uniref:hypothetical protein n=1 Tax=Marinobacter sp. Arc7-DN-1 TaxID=2304594 RepID=UPI001D0D82CA|nr:hypothetical protein [Marinobacter sp. Arc7-DN-1]
MRWMALLLLFLSLGLYYLPDYLGPSGGMAKVASGSLPRVVSLKSPDPEGGAVKVVPSQEAPVLSCVRLGWIDTAERTRELINSQPLVSEAGFAIEEVDRGLAPLYWVLIPPQPREVALRQFRDIQRQGIDSYLVTGGENRNAISLGLFEYRESAISMLEEKKRQNLNAVLVNFPRNQISYALTFEAESDLAEELVQAVKADYGNNFDFVEIRPCEGVATPEKNP